MIFKMSFQWKKGECLSQTKQFSYIFFFKKYDQTFEEKWFGPYTVEYYLELQ